MDETNPPESQEKKETTSAGTRRSKDDLDKEIAEGFQSLPVDEKILAFLYKYPDATVRQIAAVVGVSKTVVHRRMKKPSFKRAYKEMKADVLMLMGRAKIMAMRRIMELIKSEDENIALRASLGVLQGELQGESLARFAEVGGNITYAVQFGESGQVFNKMIRVPSGTNVEKVIEANVVDTKDVLPQNTLELLKGVET
jgi:DNA-binding Lrp family transcriptional regulator